MVGEAHLVGEANIFNVKYIIFRFEVDLSLGVQCRNISIPALTCLKKTLEATKKSRA